MTVNSSRIVGIDHGTSNSAIAVMEPSGPRIVKADGVSEVMPSVVYFSRFKRMLVGIPAYHALKTNPASEGQGHTGYKPDIGQDAHYEFAAAGKVMSAPELGAEVLREMLQACERETGVLPRAAVVTIPAKFDQAACEGTREAARMAGLEFSPLLQEPIAAALSYGFDTSDERAQWMVFDLGGGTLDVTLVIVREGNLAVPSGGHAGDSHLGGRLFDRALTDHVIGRLEQEYALSGFRVDNPRYAVARGRLMLAVEEAKIRMSRSPSAVVEVDGTLCEDDNGQPVEVHVPVEREEYERLIAPDVERAVLSCKNLLAMNGLTSADVDRLVLIGGPTKTPYIQRVLEERLGIQPDASIDPMTAVVRGAAIYSSTVDLPAEFEDDVTDPRAGGGVSLTLRYERHSQMPSYPLMGLISAPGDDFSGMTVEIRRGDGAWSSGQVPVDEGGMFEVELMLTDTGKPELSVFETTVRDASGQTVARAEEPEIWYPFTDMGNVVKVANSLLVGVQGNLTQCLIKAGEDLKAEGRGEFETVRALRQGSPDDLLRIPILEATTHLLGGEDPSADCHAHVGTLTIEGSDSRVTCDLPPGTALELTLEQNRSRQITAEAYVPLLGVSFEGNFQPEAYGIEVDAIEERFKGAKSRLETIRELHGRQPNAGIQEAFDTLDRVAVIDGIEREIEGARQGEAGAKSRSYRRTLELVGAVNEMWRMQARPRIDDMVGRLRDAASGDDLTELNQVTDDLNTTQQRPGATSAEDLGDIEGRLHTLDNRVRLEPVVDLFIDIFAFPDRFRGTSEQIAAYKTAEKLAGEIAEGGSIDKATPDQIRRADEAHKDLMRLWPELPDWRRTELDKRGKSGIGNADLGDIRARG